MNHIIAILKNWTLPISITMGTLVFLMFHCINVLAPLKAPVESFVGFFIPTLVFVMLFITFCKINPRHMQIKKWHLILVLFQILSCVLIAAVLFFYPSFPYRIGAEGAMVCLIAPTATAAAVITGKLGGNEASLTSYTIISNMAAAVSIPVIFPLIRRSRRCNIHSAVDGYKPTSIPFAHLSFFSRLGHTLILTKTVGDHS